MSTFEQSKAGDDCPVCGGAAPGGEMIARLDSGAVYLQDDADYRGYCILAFRRHAVELYDLTPAERASFGNDLARIGAAIGRVCAPSKLNLSMLGNAVPHLHCHLMPRYPADPEWGGPPAFRTPAERRRLEPCDHAALAASLRELLAPP